MSVNKTFLIGNLGADPEMNYTDDGKSVCNFRIATNERWNDKETGEKREKTEWHRIVVWGKQGEHCAQYLKKGRQCHIDGHIQTRDWDDRDGNKRYTTEIVGERVTFLGGKNGNQQQE